MARKGARCAPVGEWKKAIGSDYFLMDGNADTVCYQAEQMLGSKHHRLDIPVGVRRTDLHAVNDDLDDASPENIEAIRAKADDLVHKERDRIDELAKALQESKWKPTGKFIA
jgi:hypothetical protein